MVGRLIVFSLLAGFLFFFACYTFVVKSPLSLMDSILDRLTEGLITNIIYRYGLYITYERDIITTGPKKLIIP